MAFKNFITVIILIIILAVGGWWILTKYEPLNTGEENEIDALLI